MNLRRLKLIIDVVNRKYPPTLIEIHHYLKDFDIEVTDRTIWRDLRELADDFNIVIKQKKDKNRHVYTINKTESLNFEESIRSLSIMDLAYSLKRDYPHLLNTKAIDGFISFYSDVQASGAHVVNKLLKAAIDKNIVTFSYKKYSLDEAEGKTVHPYYLRQQAKNWYLFAKDTVNDDFRTYGLDRMSDLNVTGETFEKDNTICAREIFDRMVGIYYRRTDSPIDIKLKVSGYHKDSVQYVKIHHSQQVVENNDDHIIISLHVVPNAEFYTELLRYRYNIQVLEPPQVVDEMKRIVERIGELYE
jgi:proteasome accessory factor B